MGAVMCVESFVGVRNKDGSITSFFENFETSDLGMWLHCNAFNSYRVKNLILDRQHKHYRFDNLNEFSNECLQDYEFIYLWDDGCWNEKSKNSEWHHVGE